VLAALLAIVLGSACGGKVVLDALGTEGAHTGSGGAGSSGAGTNAGTGGEAGSLCTSDAGSLGGVDCYNGCTLCGCTPCGCYDVNQCVLGCIAQVQLALHSPCMTEFQAWKARAVGKPDFCGCETEACSPKWQHWAICVDNYCPGTLWGLDPHPADPGVCGLGSPCAEDAGGCTIFVTDTPPTVPLVCVANVCVAAPCGSDGM
jgi:hypothetical protein